MIPRVTRLALIPLLSASLLIGPQAEACLSPNCPRSIDAASPAPCCSSKAPVTPCCNAACCAPSEPAVPATPVDSRSLPGSDGKQIATAFVPAALLFAVATTTALPGDLSLVAPLRSTSLVSQHVRLQI